MLLCMDDEKVFKELDKAYWDRELRKVFRHGQWMGLAFGII
jgi:hypothetical protein